MVVTVMIWMLRRTLYEQSFSSGESQFSHVNSRRPKNVHIDASSLAGDRYPHLREALAFIAIYRE
jgi:hypothetical protein